MSKHLDGKEIERSDRIQALQVYITLLLEMCVFFRLLFAFCYFLLVFVSCHNALCFLNVSYVMYDILLVRFCMKFVLKFLFSRKNINKNGYLCIPIFPVVYM